MPIVRSFISTYHYFSFITFQIWFTFYSLLMAIEFSQGCNLHDRTRGFFLILKRILSHTHIVGANLMLG